MLQRGCSDWIHNILVPCPKTKTKPVSWWKSDSSCNSPINDTAHVKMQERLMNELINCRTLYNTELTYPIRSASEVAVR